MLNDKLTYFIDKTTSKSLRMTHSTFLNLGYTQSHIRVIYIYLVCMQKCGLNNLSPPQTDKSRKRKSCITCTQKVQWLHPDPNGASNF